MLLKKFIFLLLFAIFIAKPSACSPLKSKNRKKPSSVTEQERQKFQSWKQQHQKVYSTQKDEERAMTVMIANMREIEAHNLLYAAGKVTFLRDIWEYSDLTAEEKHQLLVGLKEEPVTNETQSARLMQASPARKFKAAPAEVNWVKEGLVNPVQNQGKCGSCWTYAAAGVIEGVLLKDGIKTLVSQQNLVDCSRNNGNSGCNGGFTHAALKYIANNGVASYNDYPYTGRQGKCRAKGMEKIPVDIGRVKYEKLRGNENRLRDIVANVGPVAIAMRAADDFLNYKSGVYNNPKCSRNVDHAMLLVGYGRDEKMKIDYWLVKNSWGKTWGENGYVRMARNRNNQCGIAVEVTYVV